MGDIDTDEQSDANTMGAKGNDLTSVHSRAIQRFNDVVPPQLLMRAQSLAARRFVSIPGAQWEGWFGEQWGETIKLEMPLIKRGLQKIERDYRSNRVMVDFRAASGEASAVTARTIGGIYRADNYHFKSQQARDNAFSEALRGGFGAYRLVNAWADPYDPDNDQQRINPASTIVDADQSVFFDGNAKLYDKSDAMFAWVLTAMTPQAYHAKFGADKNTTWDNDLIRPFYDWYQPDIIRVAEYYEVEEIDEKLYIFTQAMSGDEERWYASQLQPGDMAEKKALGWTVRTRTWKRRRVHKYTMSGNEVLQDNGYIAGTCIPIVPVYGNREFVDNIERVTGYVQDRMDMQRNYNARVSKLAETDALAPREVPIFAAQQMPKHIADIWANQNIERHPYAIVEPLIDPVTGGFAAIGPIGNITPPQLPPVTAALLQIARSDLEEDNQDGADEVKANTSAEAMELAATRIDAKSEIYIDNMRQSVQREGEIYQSQLADIYYEPGREVDTLDEDDEDGTATLSEGIVDKNTKVFEIHNDFSKGKYKVISDVAEATNTVRDKTVRAMLKAAEVAGTVGAGEAANVCFTIALMNMDGEGGDIAQKFARRQLLQMGLVEPNEEEIAQMEEAKANQKPDPAAQLAEAQVVALQAQAGKDAAMAGKYEADTGQSKAATVLKLAQATELGGPVSAPEVPSGLDNAERLLDMQHTIARIEDLRKPKEAA